MTLNNTLRSYIVIALLLVGLLIVYLPQLSPLLSKQVAPRAAGEFVYVADLDFWQRTERQQTVFANARFDLESDLRNVPLTVGDWQGEEVPETNQEVMILLEPEQYVQRLYQNSAGQYLWLSMIGGRSSQPFHAPDICYQADGWKFNSDSYPIELADGKQVYGLWLEAKKQMPGDEHFTEHIVFYFYLFPNAGRDLADGIVLFKLTSSRYNSAEETLALHADFVRHLFTGAQ